MEYRGCLKHGGHRAARAAKKGFNIAMFSEFLGHFRRHVLFFYCGKVLSIPTLVSGDNLCYSSWINEFTPSRNFGKNQTENLAKVANAASSVTLYCLLSLLFSSHAEQNCKESASSSTVRNV